MDRRKVDLLCDQRTRLTEVASRYFIMEWMEGGIEEEIS